MSYRRKFTVIALIMAAIGFNGVAYASNDPAMDAQVFHINNEWARIKYQVRDKGQQYRQLDLLEKQAAGVVAKYPGRAEPLLWHGIVTSEEAAMANVFKQLGLARAARDILAKANSIDSHAENGGVPMSLGVLYYKVPGFPIGFGDRKKAKALLSAALAQDPNGLDANYFFGDFLLAQGQNAVAKTYLQKALRAPNSLNRPVWDAGRRDEVRSLLAKVG
jgi:tetratricopeptide (TPR) repeat protein